MKKFSVWSILTLLTVALAASSAFAVRSQKEADELNRRKIDPRVYKGTFYAFPDESRYDASLHGRGATASVSSAHASISPGYIVGTSWYEYQANGSMKRQVQSESDGFGGHIVHFAWMNAADVASGLGNGRGYAWQAFNLDGSGLCAPSPIHLQDPPNNFRAGYVVQDVTSDGRSVVGGHQVDEVNGSLVQIYWDFGPCSAFFTSGGYQTVIPLSVADDGTPTEDEFIWPAMAVQIVDGDTVTHVVAAFSAPGAGDPQSIKYFRKYGINGEGTWEVNNFEDNGLGSPVRWALDTTYLLSYDIAVSHTTEKVAIFWTANISDGSCPGDTCSNNSGAQFVQLDNDLYVKISNDGGDTWDPRINVTQNVDGEAGFRPYANLSGLITTEDYAVCAFDGRTWPADANTGGQAGLLQGRLFFWSEGFQFEPGQTIHTYRTLHNTQWDQTTCNGGAFNLNSTKMNVAECNGKLYCLFVQFNDIPNGVEDDCAARATSEPVGSANGELYIVVSDDYGITWDEARNVTNSRSPGCDSATGVGGECYADQYPTLAEFGSNYSNANAPSETDVPGFASPDGYYLDLQYIQDPDPGGAIRPEGLWANASIAWARIGCVEKIENALLTLQYNQIAFPAWAKPATPTDTTLRLENNGNKELNVHINDFETSPVSNWLGVSETDFNVPAGFTNTHTITIHLNQNSLGAANTKVVLDGGLEFVSNAPTSPDTLPILFTVADTVIPPTWDTIYVRQAGNAVLALTVGSNGNFGNQGRGGVNLDYSDYGDCDTLNDVYMYDGSAIVGWISGADTIMNWSIFEDGWLASSTALRPFAGLPDSAKWLPRFRDCPNFEYYRSGRFVTRDTSLAMEKMWYAPKTSAGGDTVAVIQCLKVWSLSGAKSGLTIGEILDWDIPSDSGSNNTSAVNLQQSIWQRGVDYADTALEGCQADSVRFGGMKFLYRYKNAAQEATTAYSAYTARNDSFVYPSNGLVEGQTWKNFAASGFSVVPTDSLKDLHMGMSFSHNFSMAAADTFRFYTVLSSVKSGDTTAMTGRLNRGKAWFDAKTIANVPRDSCAAVSISCCVGTLRDNCDGIGGPNILDVNKLVGWLFGGGPVPPCTTECNADGSTNMSGNDTFNILDVNKLVSWLFAGGSTVAACP